MSQFRVLVTAAGGTLAPLNIKLLKTGARHEVWVAAVDSNADAAGRYFADEFAIVPHGNAASYTDEIAKLVREHRIDLVLPWSDEEALSLAADREKIDQSGATLACAAGETLEVMNDKAASFRVLALSGISIPDWTLADSESSLQQAITRYHDDCGEFVVKPTVARGNRGTFVIRDDAEGVVNFLGSRELHMNKECFIEEYFAETVAALPVMVMERLYAPAYDIDVLAKNGVLLRAMPRERMNPAGIPFTGGILRPRDDLLTLAERVTEALNLDWLYDYDLMTRKDGRPVVMELNPRPSGSIAAAILAGVPFYDDLISLAKGEPLPEVETPSEVAVIPFSDSIVVPLSSLP